ncbi:hypothetical protein [Variovorax sp. PvP013]|jgi:hypothetical protein|uniref:hypothetical protein n=1 Tax=Variovorax sp. PvP013 TaxID=3156435 RepID=UPI003D1A3795
MAVDEDHLTMDALATMTPTARCGNVDRRTHRARALDPVDIVQGTVVVRTHRLTA